MNPLPRLAFLLFLAAHAAHAALAASKPNVLLIVSDDQGYADAGFQGSKEIPPPHLDQLAASGLRCTNGYVRVPFLVSWPGTVPAGRTYDQPVSSVDVMATALAAAGAAMPADKKHDSVNLLPHLRGEKTGPPHERLYWRSGARLAVREGDWKLVRDAGVPDRLFHLASELSESKDLASEKPGIAKRLATALEAWNAELISPASPAPFSASGKSSVSMAQPCVFTVSITPHFAQHSFPNPSTL